MLRSLRWSVGGLVAVLALARCGGDSEEGENPEGGGAGKGGASAGKGGAGRGGSSGMPSGGRAGKGGGGSGGTDSPAGAPGTGGTAGSGAGMDGEGGEGAETGEGGEGAESGAGNGAGGQAGSAGGGAEGGDSGASAAGAGASGGEGGALPTCTPGTASGTRITFQSPTATFSQTSVYNFSVTQLIDGIVNDERGWAVSETNGAVNAQTAALETASNTPSYSGGTRLTFIFVQNYSLTGDHALGHFRLAVTTADRAQFADGIDGTTAAGDVGSGDSWTVLAPLSVCGLSDVAMTVQNDGSVLVAENDVVPMVYTVIAETSLTGITGVRLEALKDPSLPHEGPGLQTLNGNFVLSEFEAYYEAR